MHSETGQVFLLEYIRFTSIVPFFMSKLELLPSISHHNLQGSSIYDMDKCKFGRIHILIFCFVINLSELNCFCFDVCVMLLRYRNSHQCSLMREKGTLDTFRTFDSARQTSILHKKYIFQMSFCPFVKLQI